MLPDKKNSTEQISLSLPFSKQEVLATLLQLGAKVYLVGGPVRDFFLKRETKDIDLLVTHCPMDSLVSSLKKHGAVNQVGKSFGVIKFRPAPDQPEIDIALPRIEKSTGVGHRDFAVDFDQNIPVEHDLARRDFTINAMAYDLQTNKLIDPFQGRRDLEDKILRQVFTEAFAEDPLRLLRAVQFSARFGLSIEPVTLAAMKAQAQKIEHIAPERIIEEIKKLLLAPKPSIGFDIMKETGLLKILFPFVHKMIGIKQPRKLNEDVYQHTMRVVDAASSADELLKAGDLELMFSALLHDAGKPDTYRRDESTGKVTFYNHQQASAKIAHRWMHHFKATTIGVNTKKIENLVENHMFETKVFYTERAIRRFINKIGVEDILDLIDLRIADKKGGRFPDSMKGILALRERITTELEKKPPFGVKDLAINGHDLMGLGFKAGPIFGEIMNFLIDKVLDEPMLNTKEDMTRMVLEKFAP